jgi:hypothetical protein
MEHWFVYYRVAAVQLDALLPGVRTMIASLQRKHDVGARLMRRVDLANGQVTLMEVYERINDPAAFGQALAAAVAGADLSASVREARRLERFTDC